MSTTRHFLGWERPALHLAAEHLWAKFLRNGRCDMSRVVVATPGARAGARLLELLALRAAQGEGGAPVLLIPPHCVTTGHLPELLYESSTSIATDAEALLARYQALGQMPEETLARVYSLLPPPENIKGRLQIASELESIEAELAGEKMDYADVARHCEKRGLSESAARWRVLEEIQNRSEAVLESIGCVDKFRARAQACQGGQFAENLQIVLLATVDLPSLTVGLLKAGEGEIHVMIHAPETHAAGFDAYGRIDKSYWHEAVVPLRDEDIEIVEQPVDEAHAVLEFVDELNGIEPGHVIVGLGDEALGETIERTLEAHGHAARQASRLTLEDSPPVLLLRLLAQFAASRKAQAFAALLRHPDFENWLVIQIGEATPATGLVAAWDVYYSHHLQASLGAGGKRPSGVLGQVLTAIEELLAPLETKKPLGQWPQQFGDLLASIYGSRRYDADNPTEANMARSLAVLGQKLGELAELRVASASLPPLAFADAVTLLLSLCGEEPLPEPGGESAIELLGWLEIPLDDAPALALTGVNEGSIPGSINAAPFLPDRLRRELGLVDNARRYARDAYLLSAVSHSRQRVRIIAGKRSAQNDPLAPSRLLFACEEDAVIRRSLEFYGEVGEATPRAPLWPHGESYQLAAIPRPSREGEPIRELRVTAFRDYLACPYRFYLKHICRLETVGDGGVELEFGPFGNLLHDVLKAFDEWIMEAHGGFPPADAAPMNAFLQDQLQRLADERFGARKLPAVAVQVHQMGRRLARFAERQAQEAEQGWQIIHAEKDLRHAFQVEGAPFEVYGRVDRIDFHPGQQRYRILDYKSSDKGSGPEQTHRVRSEDGLAWRDLQLPLYRKMARQLGIDEESVEVGYITLPRKLESVDFVMAPWDEAAYRDAYQLANDVMRCVRGRIFWPPTDPPPAYDDGLAAICLDRSLDRAAIIAQPRVPAIHWTERQAHREVSEDEQ